MSYIKKNFFITTAISYPNGVPHIGHAYEAIVTDVIARFKRLDGYDVIFSTGTDEHGQKIEKTADDQGMTPLELIQELTPKFKEMVACFHCSNDDFICTSEERHHIAVKEIWQSMSKKGDIYKDYYKGWYSIRDEAYYPESELRTDDLGEKCSPNGTPVEWVEKEESYFFRLSCYTEKLLKLYEEYPNFIQPKSCYNEIVSFVKKGLEDLSISRTRFGWGVKVPDDPKHVIYVWVDALTHYLTALGYPHHMNKDYWPPDLHIIGKDITRFHAVYWPAFLMSVGLDIPKKIFAHGFLTMRGEKMSKSAGNVVDPFEMIDCFGVESLRYFFTREINFGQDGRFSYDAIIRSVNSGLANDLGNLVQRCLSMIQKNCGGILCKGTAFTEEDKNLLFQADNLLNTIRQHVEKLEIHHYVSSVFVLISETNKYFTAQEPWRIKNTDNERTKTVLYVTVEVIRQIAIALQPILPERSQKLLDFLVVPQSERQFIHLGEAYRLSTEIQLPEPFALFPRLRK